MIKRKVRCTQKAGGRKRSNKAFAWRALTAKEAGRLEVGEAIGAVIGGQRINTIVIAKPYIGKKVTSVKIGYLNGTKHVRSVGRKMECLIRPIAEKNAIEYWRASGRGLDF